MDARVSLPLMSKDENDADIQNLAVIFSELEEPAT
jgi:hypothetical protein